MSFDNIETHKHNNTCYIVMSGGIGLDAQPPQHVVERCKHLQQVCDENDYAIFSSIFSLNIPQRINAEGYVISEAKTTYDYFRSISPKLEDRCFLEHSSFDSIGSVYFSLRMISDLGLHIQSVKFITSSFHAVRTRFIVRNVVRLINFNLDVDVVSPNSELSIDDKKRSDHEKLQLRALKSEFRLMKSAQDFTRWLYNNHDNYALRFKSKQEMTNSLY